MKKVLSFLLVLTLVIGLLVPGTLAIQANAADGDANAGNSGMVINKTAKAVDGGYEITLEAYATGSKVISSVYKDVPTDIVLVIDQSGSMSQDFSKTTEDSWVSYGLLKNSENYEKRMNNGYSNNGNLYHKLSDGSYVGVSVERAYGEQRYTYTPFSGNNNSAYSSWNELYAKVDENYYKVTVTRTGKANNYTYTYEYTDASGSKVSNTSNGSNNQPPITLYTQSTTYEYVYTYSYTINGQKTEIGTSTGADTVFGTELYKKVSAGASITKLDSLKNAVSNFVEEVNRKAKGADGQYGTEDDINHRIAVVGFGTGNDSQASDDASATNPKYKNTELFIGSNEYNYGMSAQSTDKETLASSKYSSAFQDMNTQQGYNNVIASKNAFSASGATQVDLGIEMANGILDANPVSTGEKRNRVVIVFTDGVPSSWSDYSSTVANNAISKADTTKNKYNATVYTVGIFSGADATSAGNQNGNDTQKANWFMQKVSSNNGTVQNPSYYLSAGDSESLNKIFQQIADKIESGGTVATLDSSTVIKDIVADQFQLPAGATEEDITIETYACTGKNGDNYTWQKNDTAMGAHATIDPATGEVYVTGFDFAANYVGTVTENETTTYLGHKLVIKFTVQVKDGFLGGNDVYTNTSAGVYENAEATEPVLTFPRPTVNVPIGDVGVTVQEKNVYLLGGLTADQLKTGATVTCGNVELKLNEANYGLQPWQTDYVDITVTYTDAKGNTITGLSNLTDDTTYTISVTVSSKPGGSTTTEKHNSGEGKINVFKPELIYKDSFVYYGDDVPRDASGKLDFSANLTRTMWAHRGVEAVPDNMIGDAPELRMDYTIEPGKLDADGKIYSKDDVPVGVTVSVVSPVVLSADNAALTDVTEHTNFVHINCGNRICKLPEDKEFLLHVEACSLTITKQGEEIGDDEYFVFNIFKDHGSEPYTQVTIKGATSVTISELPVGEYTVVEDEATAWRYKERTVSDGVNLNSGNTTGTITCTNSNKNNQWLNHFAQVTNTYGDKKN